MIATTIGMLIGYVHLSILFNLGGATLCVGLALNYVLTAIATWKMFESRISRTTWRIAGLCLPATLVSFIPLSVAQQASDVLTLATSAAGYFVSAIVVSAYCRSSRRAP